LDASRIAGPGVHGRLEKRGVTVGRVVARRKDAMRHPAHGREGATLVRTVALLVLVLWLLCLVHGADHDEFGGGLCAGMVLLSLVVALDADPRLSRRFRPAPAFALYTTLLELPDLPPEIRPV
jgi:hypothetical protein